jgi:hypothetical protein
MVSRALRSRTVEANQDDNELPARESDKFVSLSSESESVEIAAVSQQEVAGELEPEPQAVELVEVRGENAKECADHDPSELKQMLAGMMAMIQQSVRKDIGSVKADINSVKTDITSKFNKLQEDLRVEIKSENEKLIKKFELQNQKSHKELSAKVDTESRRLTKMVGQLQKETEAELVAVKGQIQAVNTCFETQLEDSNNQIQTRSEKLEQEVTHKFTRQGESIGQISQVVTEEKPVTESRLNQMNAKIVALESRVSDVTTRVIVAEESRSPCNNISPPVVHQNSQTSEIGNHGNNPMQMNENHTISGQASTCNLCESETRVNVHMQTSSVSSFLSSTELPLPLFDDSTDTNPVFHLRQLDEFIQLKGVPKAYQLAVAYRSVVGQMGKQWIENVSRNLPENFSEYVVVTFPAELVQDKSVPRKIQPEFKFVIVRPFFEVCNYGILS